MTEEEWLRTNQLGEMLELIHFNERLHPDGCRGPCGCYWPSPHAVCPTHRLPPLNRVSHRKKRLALVGSCSYHLGQWGARYRLPITDRSKKLLMSAYACAEAFDRGDLRQSIASAEREKLETVHHVCQALEHLNAGLWTANEYLHAFGHLSDDRSFGQDADKRLGKYADFLREVVGNPFRPLPTVRPEWLDANDQTAGNIARLAYDQMDFSSLPILADALEDAGCAEQLLLDHLRGVSLVKQIVHVRGCWALDLILGKE
jgi:hypothetical protein